MRRIERSGQFKADYKLIKKQPRHMSSIDDLLREVVTLLVEDSSLPDKYSDHALSGDWHGYRDCHLKPDLILIYKCEGEDLLRLARLGSHSNLFR
jgi:mRNA interferase YafQ